MSDKVVRLETAFERANLTPEETLASCRTYAWDKVIVIGYASDDPNMVVRTSNMSRQDALWLAEQLKLHILQIE